jgi:ferric-dicitrate binding protein FerR (iron transport regulator)
LGRLSAGQLQHFNALLKVQAAEVQKQRSEHQDTQQRILEKLDELTALSTAQASREIQSHQASKGRFVWLLTGLAVNCAVLLTLLAKSFLAAGI